jgi:ligand-binding sensor domain-containing protein/signal transduction histidine kinase/CheY-like chemotaxis protein/HPt (histidine-containing phosphotransfer) domain-containing protein
MTLSGLALALALAWPASALDPARAVTQYQLDGWRTPAGLPSETVGALARTRDGYLWVGTAQGLARFDGVRFTVHDNRTTAVLSGSVEALLQDRAGTLWIGLGHGLARYDSRGFSAPPPGLPDAPVASLVEDLKGRLWAGTRGAGLFRLDGDRFNRVAEASMSGRRIRALIHDRAGVLWAGTEKGLFSIGDDGQAHRAEGLADDNVFALLEDHAGRLWIGTNGGVEGRRPDGSWETFTRAQGLTSTFLRTLAEDPDGNIWVGTEDGGLVRLRNGRAVSLTVATGLPADAVVALLADAEGLLWVGTDGGGLVRLKDGAVTPVTTREGLARDQVMCVLEDSRGAVWTGTRGGGLQRIGADGTVTSFTTREGLGSDTVDSLAEDPAGTLWAGTYAGGLARFDGRRFERVPGVPGEAVYALLAARDGGLWIGTYGGGLVHRNLEGRLTFWGKKDGLPSDSIFGLLEDRTGTLWVGTSRGPARIRGGRVLPWSPDAPAPTVTVLTFHEDPGGAMWLSTSDMGLRRFAEGRWSSVTTANGLPSDEVGAILADSAGVLWMNTTRGIARVEPAELAAVADGSRARLSPDVLGVADGMRSPEAYGGTQPSAWRGRDGRFWFCTRGGLAVVDPSRLAAQDTQVPVVVEEALADGRRLTAAGGSLIVPPSTRSLEIHYAGLSLRAPERVRFRYRLEGFDATWVDAGTRRTAYWSRPPGGTYRFEVSASAGRAEPGESPGASLALSVGYAWHEKTAVRAAVLVLLVGLAWAGHRVRTWRLLLKERELTALVAERTEELREANAALAQQNTVLADNVRLQEEVERMSRHDLRTPVAGMIALLRRLRHEPGSADRRAELLSLMERAGYRLLDLVNLSVDMLRMEKGTYRLRPQAVDLHDVVRRVARDLAPHAAAAGVALNVENARAVAEAEDLLSYSMLANLMKNALEASPEGGAVTVTFFDEDERVGVRIHNPGAVPVPLRERFFDKFSTSGKAGGTGLGTYSARLMAETQRGRISMTTSEGDGTTITVILPAAAITATPGHAPEAEATAGAPGREGQDAASSALLPALTVLIVEDDPLNVAVLQACLPVPPLRVETAANGRAGLKAAARNHPDVVFLDMEMPVMGGLEMVTRLREEERSSSEHAFVVGFTAHEDEATRRRMLEAGCDRCLVKPASPDEILAVLHESVRSSKGEGLTTLVENLPNRPAHGPANEEMRKDEEWAGFDRAAGLRRVGGNATLYAQLVTAFRTRVFATVEEVASALAASDTEAVLASLHGLKGTAATLGAVDLARAAAALESRVRDGAEPDVVPLRKAAEVIARVALPAEAPATTQASAPSPAAAGEAKLAIRRLQPLLEGNDMDALACFEELRATLLAVDPDATEAVAASLLDLDFSAASTVVRDLAARLEDSKS